MNIMEKKRKSTGVNNMEEVVTFNEIRETLNFYIIRASDERLSGWEQNHYRE